MEGAKFDMCYEEGGSWYCSKLERSRMQHEFN